MNVSVSVIIPIYNGEKYIPNMLKCLLNQSFQDYEVLLINDGSTDDSARLCNEAIKKDSRFRHIQKENGGVSTARNRGLQEAKGKYIAFVDVDDYLEKDYLYQLMTCAIKSQADIICSDYIEVSNYEDERLVTGSYGQWGERIITERKNLFEDFFSTQLSQDSKTEFYPYTVWGKLIKTELAQKETFAAMKFAEDLQYMLALFMHSPKVAILGPYRGYYYIRWDQSVTKTVSVESKQRQIVDELNCTEFVYNCVKTIGDNTLLSIAEQYYTDVLYRKVSIYTKTNHINDEFYKMIKAHIKNVERLNRVSNKQKIVFLMFKYFPTVYKALLRV